MGVIIENITTGIITTIASVKEKDLIRRAAVLTNETTRLANMGAIQKSPTTGVSTEKWYLKSSLERHCWKRGGKGRKNYTRHLGRTS